MPTKHIKKNSYMFIIYKYKQFFFCFLIIKINMPTYNYKPMWKLDYVDLNMVKCLGFTVISMTRDPKFIKYFCPISLVANTRLLVKF